MGGVWPERDVIREFFSDDPCLTIDEELTLAILVTKERLVVQEALKDALTELLGREATMKDVENAISRKRLL